MNICSHCRTQQPSSDVTSCIECGYPIEPAPENSGLAACSEPTGFVVTEASANDQELVGGQSGAGRKQDDLGIESTSHLMECEAQRENGRAGPDSHTNNMQPIGDSAPPPPPTLCESPDKYPQKPVSESDVEITEKTPGSNGVKKLSEDEVKRIEQNLYGTNSYLKSQEKKELKEKLEGIADSEPNESTDTPAPPPSKPQMATPQKAKRSQGLAYFYRNYVEIRGHQALITNDILQVNNREYVLKPKKIRPGILIAGFAAVLVVSLILIASFMTTDVVSGAGQLVGVVLDEYNQPYIKGAVIRIPEFGKTIETDARGFFAAGELPTGTHEIEYIVDGEVVKVEYASITPGEIRMVFLRPSPVEEYSQAEPVETVPTASPPPREVEPTPVVVKEEPVVKKTAPKKTPTKSTEPATSKSSKPTYAKVTLDANVDGARFEIDGSTMGAGNLTYSRIKAGKHNYRVSADGYESAEGTLILEGGQQRTLAVNLKPLQQQAKAAEYDTDDYFFSGKSALNSGDYKTAIADFSQAISNKPSYADAYFERAEAHQKLKELDKAHDDYIQAAEIYQIKKNYGRAITSYNGALDCDKNSVTAYVGRGSALMKKGETLAAIADFDKTIYIDKRCFEGYFGLGEARFKQQQFSKAIKHFKDARSVNSKNPLVHQYLMLSYLAVNDVKNVKKSFEKFADIASEEQMDRFKTDQKYSAVLRVVDSQ